MGGFEHNKPLGPKAFKPQALKLERDAFPSEVPYPRAESSLPGARVASDKIPTALRKQLPSGCSVRQMDRRAWLMAMGGLGVLFSWGCDSASTDGADRAGADVTGIWGKRGLSNGKFHKPRAMTIDAQGMVYVVDMTARIQVFDARGEYVRHWQTPICEQGRPTGLSIDRRGRVAVADTHYFRVLFYDPVGELQESATIGGVHGTAPGEFGFVTDVLEDAEGNFYISEYGASDRIQKFTASGEFICQWGGHGAEPGQFERPQSIGMDSKGNIWVADACNHRLQVYRCDGDRPELIKVIGRQGEGAGEFRYPYGLTIDRSDRIWISEFGGHRIQCLDSEGKSLLSWGKPGRNPGELANPWSIALHSDGDILIVDSGNHRIQKVRL
jgi:sugar lactone lactonase YvrE